MCKRGQLSEYVNEGTTGVKTAQRSFDPEAIRPTIVHAGQQYPKDCTPQRCAEGHLKRERTPGWEVAPLPRGTAAAARIVALPTTQPTCDLRRTGGCFLPERASRPTWMPARVLFLAGMVLISKQDYLTPGCVLPECLQRCSFTLEWC